MHDYAVFSHNRVSIARWLGVASVFGASLASGFIVWIAGLHSYLAVLTGFTVTGSLAYLGLNSIFNKIFWKLPLFKIPVLHGVWEVSGRTLNEDNSERYPWEAECTKEAEMK